MFTIKEYICRINRKCCHVLQPIVFLILNQSKLSKITAEIWYQVNDDLIPYRFGIKE
jgi:hypothetical protein